MQLHRRIGKTTQQSIQKTKRMLFSMSF